MFQILGFLGLIIVAVAGIWMLVASFQVSLGWGLACLFISPAILVFVFAHWDEAKKPFMWMVIGSVLLVASAALAPRKLEQPAQTDSHLHRVMHQHLA